MPSRLHIYCISFVLHVVVSDLGLITLDHTADVYVERLCGVHPLTSILEKIATKPISHKDILKMLARIRSNYPKLWKGYQMALTKCVYELQTYARSWLAWIAADLYVVLLLRTVW